MSMSAQQATQPVQRKDIVLGGAFALAAVAIGLLLWPSGSLPADQQLRVFLIGWTACGLLLASVTAASARQINVKAAKAVLWLGLGLVTGLGLGTMSWSDFGSRPLWQLWLTGIIAVGYVQQLQHHGRHSGHR